MKKKLVWLLNKRSGIVIPIFTFFLIWTLARPNSSSTIFYMLFYSFLPIIGVILGCVISKIGLACYARAKGRNVGWEALALLPVIGPVIGLIVLARPHDLSYTEVQPRRSYFYLSSFLTAIILYLIDAFVLNQGIIAFITAVVVIFVLLPKTLFAAFKKDRELLKKRAFKAAIYTVMIIAIVTSIRLNNLHARDRAEQLIVACRQYEARYQRLPDKLEDLVPEFITHVPKAKFTLIFNQFSYTSSQDHHWLMWVELPPFGRPYYDFEGDRWNYMD